MKREIKFKAECIKSNDWVFGDLIHGVGSKSGNIYILPNKKNLAYVKHCDPLDGVQVDPETICQFIDTKNDVDFWENDTVYHEVLGEGLIIWGSTGFFVKYKNQTIALHEDWAELKVTGNIHNK